jgi:oxygen-independent coproporphyrinogen-3 oxidase
MSVRVPDGSDGSDGSYGVYVHVPFCARRCDYCDFATWTDRSHLIDAYVEACIADYRRRAAAGETQPATSVYFGGGTPSLLPARLLARILDAIERAGGAEVTVECNPDSVDEEKLTVYRTAGVTRLSFGVQSMVPHVLAALGRTHEPGNVGRGVALARALGFESFNLDVIYGTPAESVDDWRRTLDEVLALDPPHVSAYALTVEPATPLGRRVAAGLAVRPDDDVQATRYEAADDAFAARGLAWYEISSWARPGHECRHNLGYWDGSEHLAIGCAAHGYTDGTRWWNVRTPERYIDRIDAGRSPVAGHEHLDDPAHAEERLGLSLRTRNGAAVTPAAEGEAQHLVEAGLLERHGPRAYRLSRRGRLLATEVTARLLLAGAASSRPSALAAAAGAPGTRYD